MTLGTTLHLG